MDTMESATTVGGGKVKRLRIVRSEEEKRRILAEASAPGASVAAIARRHGLNANLLFTWRRQFGAQLVEPKDLAPILPVTITADAHSAPGGQMEIVLAGGDRIIVWSDVETAALMRVLKAMAQR
jgi:transposase